MLSATEDRVSQGKLSIGRYRFHLLAQAPIQFPPFIGSTLRGGLGHVLRRFVCVTHFRSCDRCLLRYTCAYPVLFQPYAPPEHPERQRYARMPSPFVLNVPFISRAYLQGGHLVPLSYVPGEMFTFDLTILGPANAYIPYYIYAIIQLAQRGIGRREHTFTLHSVEAVTDKGLVPIYQEETGTMLSLSTTLPIHPLLETSRFQGAKYLRVYFRTPARIDLDGDLVYPIEFEHLIRALLQRWRALETCYGPLGPVMNSERARVLIEEAKHVQREEDTTRWLDLSRYSSRQQTRMKMGGAVGTLVYSADDFHMFAPLLTLGELLHVGKLTSMGLGHMEVTTP